MLNKDSFYLLIELDLFQDVEKRNWEDSEANLYWKYKAKEFYAKSQEKLDSVSYT